MQTSGGPMSGKVRVYEVAKQLNLDPKQVVGLFQAIGIADVRNHMSSVELEAVERIKRHLEKQRTHDVVEERIRTDGRVVKRRAIAKPGGPTEPAPSARQLIAPASARVVEDVPSQPETNGHPPEPMVVREVDSARLPIPEERKSVKTLEPSPPPPTPEPPVAAAAPVAEPAGPPPSPEPQPAGRTSSQPKTGVEYWTGRPGVPM